MRAPIRSVIAIVACVAALSLVNYSIFGIERKLASGRVVLIELALVIPRSNLQGDYMELRFNLAPEVRKALNLAPIMKSKLSPFFSLQSEQSRRDGRIVAGLDANGIATYRRLDDGTPPAGDEVLLQYRVREGQIKFAGNSFFFQEGTAERFKQARYAEFRVAPDGDLLLTGLRDRYFTPL